MKGHKCSASVHTEKVVGATQEAITGSPRKSLLVTVTIQVEVCFSREPCDIQGAWAVLQ
jgi:hypothetical protein